MVAKDNWEFLNSISPGYTRAMYEGNEPAGIGHELIGGGHSDRWATKWGGGESVDGVIQHCSFNLNRKVTIYIVGNMLRIVDLRHDGKTDVWLYANSSWVSPTYFRQHELEPARIERYLNTKIPGCKFWDMVQKRAKDLYLADAS